MFRAHVEATFESAHRNGPAGHKCAGTIHTMTPDIARWATDAGVSLDDQAQLAQMLDFHGHSWLCEIEWEYGESQLDENYWGPDFGKVKALIRDMDHHNLNLMFEFPSAEFLTKHLYKQFRDTFGFAPAFVKVHEGRGNTMTYNGD